MFKFDSLQVYNCLYDQYKILLLEIMTNFIVNLDHTQRNYSNIVYFKPKLVKIQSLDYLVMRHKPKLLVSTSVGGG